MPLSEGCCGSKALWSASSVEARDENPCGSKDSRVIEFFGRKEARENGYIGIRAFFPVRAFFPNLPFVPKSVSV